MSSARIRFEPVTAGHWSQLEDLFGEKGACGGCWCMHWRLKASDYNAGKGAGNKRRLRNLTRKFPPGILALSGKEAVGWISMGPREDFPRLSGSRILKPLDDSPTWSIVCLFIRKDHRRQGLSTALINAAAQFARKSGAERIEAYPVDQPAGLPDVFAFTGTLSGYLKAGFREVARRSPTRPIVRLNFT